VALDVENGHELAVLGHGGDAEIGPSFWGCRKDAREEEPSKKAIFGRTFIQAPAADGGNFPKIEWGTVLLHLDQRKNLESQLCPHVMETVKGVLQRERS
jgi:hypothetical protein